ncbi:phosphatidylethanolamine-binding protein [Macrophomina phaseolina]|uniref:Phosphatidylethanolamine-binding protein n=1 Tax=Macrophomina phaseolina TaxID=35725 RepID=A0ABQ8FPS2_9PEZI|nr:phosphatidylethanolamine-binding protein [Macrophomina phaseolina]
MQPKLLFFGLLAGTAGAQTPPFFDPRSDVNLPAAFDVNSNRPQFFINGGVFGVNATQSVPQLYLPVNFTTNGTTPATFIVLMVDPDAPSPQHPSVGEWLHWLQPGVRLSRSIEPIEGPTGTALAILSASETGAEAIASYQEPSPPSLGPHRYIIMLFEQTDSDFKLPPSLSRYDGGAARDHFNSSEFRHAAGLNTPLAATFFIVGNSTEGDGSLTYTGDDAAAGIGGNTTSLVIGSSSGCSL